MLGVYSQRPLPATFHQPGRSPHPEPYLFRESWSEADWRILHEWLYGVDLFNGGYFWESHEAWESLWQTTDKTESSGLFLRGLIQAAACLLKVREGNARGVALLGARCLDTLQRVESRQIMGLELGAWRDDLRTFLRNPGLEYPRLILRF